MARKRNSKSYIVSATKVVQLYESDNLKEAYDKAMLLSKVEDEVSVEEVSKRCVIKFKGGKVCNE